MVFCRLLSNASMAAKHDLNDDYAGVFGEALLQRVGYAERFWGPLSLSADGEASLAQAEMRTFAEAFADGVHEFAGDVRKSARGLTFLELANTFRRDGFFGSVLLPLCLKYPEEGRLHAPSWRVKASGLLPAERVRLFDLRRRR